LEVLSKLWDVGRSLPFDSTYLSADTYGNIFLYPGMLVSFNEAGNKYIPFHASGSYGSYSAYLEGIIYTMYEFTFEEQIVAPASRCAAVTGRCYEYGGSIGDISAEAKLAQSLAGTHIQWD